MKNSFLPCKFREGIHQGSPNNSPDLTKKGSVIQRNYILNDVEALKKKIKAEKRQKDLSITEAKDGSSVTVTLKAPLFEFVKTYFIQEIQSLAEIKSVKNAEGVKVASETGGDAFVEYLMEISFQTGDTEHSVKLTAYTTTSKLQVQAKYEKPVPRGDLEGKTAPRFFVDKFVVP